MSPSPGQGLQRSPWGLPQPFPGRDPGHLSGAGSHGSAGSRVLRPQAQRASGNLGTLHSRPAMMRQIGLSPVMDASVRQVPPLTVLGMEDKETN